jgi:hypothetical protein
MATVRRLIVVLFGVLVAAGASATVSSNESIDARFDRGLARTSDGWVVSGASVLARLDDRLQTTQRVDDVIPSAWAKRGFDQIGDVDVAGDTLYVPFERPDERQDGAGGEQAMARYDANTLRFVDATVVEQDENAFVAVDGASGIAYSMDRADGDQLLRYDVRAGWRRLAPLQLDRTVNAVRGGAVARDAIWLASDDDNALFRVDIDSGAVEELGTAPPSVGVVAGLDAAEVSAGDLHATVVTADASSVTFDHFRISDAGAIRSASKSETSWPPALIYFAIALAIAALGAVGTVFWRARTTLHPKRRPEG